MNKTIILVIAVLAVCSLLFAGCVIPATGNGATNIASEKDAAKTIADVSTDLSGITNSLNEINSTLTDQNAP